MTAQTSTKLTYDDYLLLPEDGKRYEIIDGELYVTASPVKKHQIVAGNLHGFLWNYTRNRRTGTVFIAPFDVILSNVDILQPDVLFITKEHADLAQRRGVAGAPDLVIEVLSDSTRKTDEIIKRKRYEQFGVAEYWVVDPVLESVKIYRRTATAFERIAEITTEQGGTLTSPLLPGFALDVHDIFAE